LKYLVDKAGDSETIGVKLTINYGSPTKKYNVTVKITDAKKY